MPIRDHDFANAVLEIFARRGLAAGEVMWVSRLEQFWAQTRLRRSDLLAALAQLATDGLLDFEEQGEQVNLALTAAGERKAQEVLRSEIDYGGHYLRQQLFPRLRTRIEAESASGGGRRDYEQYRA